MAKTDTYSTDEIIAALRGTNGLVSLAAKHLHCSVNTIYTRARRVKAVQEMMDQCRDELVDHAELALRSCVLNKEPWAVAMVLKTLGRHRGYVEKQELDVTSGGKVIAIREVIVELPKETDGANE